MFERLDLIIINRSFWPVYPVIGEALLRFAELQAQMKSVGVIFQDHVGMRKHLLKEKRGEKVKFYPTHSFSVSGSSILRRIFDAIFFMLWVFLVLFLKRPKKVYVSTDPPVIVPFIVMVYCKIFRAKLIYHLQDIHPEAANVVVTIRPRLFHILRWLDSITARQADVLITITNQMADYVRLRIGAKSSIYVVSNPSVSFDQIKIPAVKAMGFTFCGNAGRLQRIPLLIDSIKKYYQMGGRLPFVFAGAGIYADKIKELASEYSSINYLGLVPASIAAQINADYTWAMLPIDDEVTKYAFPSKSSSYVFSGALIAAICGDQTSVAKWVKYNNLGVVIKPQVENLCQFFFDVEHGKYNFSESALEREDLKKDLSFDMFLNKLGGLVG